MNILNEKPISFWLVSLLHAVGLALIGCSSKSEEIESTELAPTAVPPTQAPASGVPALDGIVDVVWEWETLKNRDPNQQIRKTSALIGQPL